MEEQKKDNNEKETVKKAKKESTPKVEETPKTSTESKTTTEDVKKEAADTVKQVKDTIKSTNLKKDANEAKGFFIEFFKNPIKQVEVVAKSSKNIFLKIAIIILVLWLIAALLTSVINIFQYGGTYYQSFGSLLRDTFSNILVVIESLLAPILLVAVLSATVYLLQKGEKKSFLNIATSVLVAQLPIVISGIVALLNVFGTRVYMLTNYFSYFCTVISSILLYFTVKNLYKEKEDSACFKKFAIIIAIFALAQFILSFFGINI